MGRLTHLLLAAIALLPVQLVSADSCCCEWAPPSVCLDGFYVRGDVLFLRPCTDDLYFTIKGIKVDNSPVGKELATKPDYDVGYAVALGTEFCCGRGAFELGWQYFDSTSTRTITTTAADGQFLWDTVSAPDLGLEDFEEGFARGRAQFEYLTVDSSFQWGLNPCSCLPKVLIGGLRYSKINFRQNVMYLDRVEPALVDVLNTSNAWGLGPFAALRADYDLWCGISAFGRIEGGLLIGRIEARTMQTNSDNNDLVDVKKERACRSLFHYAFELGLEGCFQWDCMQITGSVGYRMEEYLSAIQRVSFYDRVREGASSSGNNSFELSGFFIRLQLAL